MLFRSLVGGLVLVTAAMASGCGYDCHAKCLEIEDELKYRNRDTGLIDLRDPCDQQELRDASSCEECEKAFGEVFQEAPPNLTCDCGESSTYAGSDGILVSYYDDACVYHSEQFSTESCEEYLGADLGDWETCAEQEQES